LSILRNRSRDRFTVIDNSLIEDERLNGVTLGLLTYLLSKPDGWVVRTSHICKLTTIAGELRFGGRDKIRGMFRDLEEFGYLEYRYPRSTDGTIIGKEIVLREASNRKPENTVIGDSTEALKTPYIGDNRPTVFSGPLVSTDYLINTDKNLTNTKGKTKKELVCDKPEEKTLNREARKNTSDRFAAFWAIYPNKVAKPEALAAWQKGGKNKNHKFDQIADELLSDIRRRIAQDDKWRRGYIPMPTTYLNQDRWLDDISQPPLGGKKQSSTDRTLAAMQEFMAGETH